MPPCMELAGWFDPCHVPRVCSMATAWRALLLRSTDDRWSNAAPQPSTAIMSAERISHSWYKRLIRWVRSQVLHKWSREANSCTFERAWLLGCKRMMHTNAIHILQHLVDMCRYSNLII